MPRSWSTCLEKGQQRVYWCGKKAANNDCPVAGKGCNEFRGPGVQRHYIDMKKKAVIVPDTSIPFTKGTWSTLNNAKSMADELFVIVHNDHQRALKGSKEFQSEEERMIIVSNIRAVDHAILSVDEDRTVCATLEKIANEYGDSYELSFANGGDQNNDTIPERPICEKTGIALIDGLGNKIQPSSWLLNKL